MCVSLVYPSRFLQTDCAQLLLNLGTSSCRWVFASVLSLCEAAERLQHAIARDVCE